MGHAILIQKNLRRAGLINEIIHLKDGQEVLNFFSGRHETYRFVDDVGYLLLLDIRMPKIDGVQVLEEIKKDKRLCSIPTIMLTTTNDPREIEVCHELGCNCYITKPIDYDQFIDAIRQLGLFLSIVEVPQIHNLEDNPAESED